MDLAWREVEEAVEVSSLSIGIVIVTLIPNGIEMHGVDVNDGQRSEETSIDHFALIGESERNDHDESGRQRT